jgi:hypothetical protein
MPFAGRTLRDEKESPCSITDGSTCTSELNVMADARTANPTSEVRSDPCQIVRLCEPAIKNQRPIQS